jgi:hypothetical protein
MTSHIRTASLLCALLILGCAGPLAGQQKPQWAPGQSGLNAGILPNPGATYANITLNYNAGTYNGADGSSLPASGSYNIWAIENIFYYVPKMKVLGGNLGFMVVFPTVATGSLAADFQAPVNGIENLKLTGGGTGLADIFLQPFTLGWHLKRVDFLVADAFMLPTGRYSPGATNNIGFGYFGNHAQTGTTAYLTKNKATSVNLFTDWEVHGSRSGANSTSKTPGQAFTTEWGFGQLLPLKKDFSQLLQVGVIGYDQWQITDNGGTTPVGPITVPASTLPHYSVHAVGGQVNYILPKTNLSFNFKMEHEYKSSSHALGNTIAFGGAWTFKVLK